MTDRRSFLLHGSLVGAGLLLSWLDEQNAKCRELEPNEDAPNLFRNGQRIAWADQTPGDRIVAWVKPKWLRFEWVVVAAPSAEWVEVADLRHAPPGGGTEDVHTILGERPLLLRTAAVVAQDATWKVRTFVARNPHLPASNVP